MALIVAIEYDSQYAIACADRQDTNTPTSVSNKVFENLGLSIHVVAFKNKQLRNGKRQICILFDIRRSRRTTTTY